MTVGPENKPQSHEPVPVNPESESKSWVPKFVVNGIEKAIGSVRQARVDGLNDKIHDLDTSQSRTDKRAENIQYRNLPRATVNANLVNVYDGLKPQPENDGYVRKGARKRHAKNVEVMGRRTQKHETLTAKAEDKKSDKREKLTRKKNSILEKDPSVQDHSVDTRDRPVKTETYDKTRVKEVKSKFEANLDAAKIAIVDELIAKTQGNQTETINEHALRSKLRHIDGSSQFLASMTLTKLQEQGVIGPDGSILKSHAELLQIATELNPDRDTDTQTQQIEVQPNEDQTSQVNHTQMYEDMYKTLPGEKDWQVKKISKDTIDRLSGDLLEEYLIDLDQPEGAEKEVVADSTASELAREDIVDAELVEDSPEISEDKVSVEQVQTGPSAEQPLTKLTPGTFETESTIEAPVEAIALPGPKNESQLSPESSVPSTEIPTEELVGIKDKIAKVTAEMVDYVLKDTREKSGNPNAKLTEEKIAEVIKDSRDYILRKEIISRFGINQADETLEQATLEGISVLTDEIIDLTVSKAAALYAELESKIKNVVQNDKSDTKIGLKWRNARNEAWDKEVAALPIEDRKVTLRTFRELKKEADEARIAKNEARKAEIAEREARKSAQRTEDEAARAVADNARRTILEA